MNNSFEQMLSIVLQAQIPHIIVRYVEEEYWGKTAVFNHIILPDNRGKVVQLSFVLSRGRHSDAWTTSFVGVDALNMSFDKAIVHYSNEVLKNQGANLELRGC